MSPDDITKSNETSNIPIIRNISVSNHIKTNDGKHQKKEEKGIGIEELEDNRDESESRLSGCVEPDNQKVKVAAISREVSFEEDNHVGSDDGSQEPPVSKFSKLVSTVLVSKHYR